MRVVDRTPFGGRPPLPSTAVMGRVLRCTRPDCGKLIDLVEIPGPDVDPDKYVCLDHFGRLRTPGQFRASGFATTNEAPKPEAPSTEPPSTEPPAPPRDLGPEIRHYLDTAFGSAA